MIDLKEEEFLRRLDIRLSAISTIIAHHEKHLLRDLPRKELRLAEHTIDEMLLRYHDFISESDEKMKRIFKEAEFKSQEVIKNDTENRTN